MGVNVKSKLFVITGSAGGLGKAFAMKLLTLGGKVCISDINEALGQSALSELSQEFGEDRVVFVKCDVTKEESVKNLIEQAEKLLDAELHCFINNAGVMGEKEGWRLCMDINLTGVLHGTNLAMDQMSKENGRTGGIIVNVASILGLFCAEQPKGYQYNVSKSAVVTLTRCIGNELYYSRTGVKVMCLCPSVTQTPILNGCTQEEISKMKKDVGGLMTPESIAEAFLQLLEDGINGGVMSTWNNCPPYYIPDTGMMQFILFTTCSMVARYIPGVKVLKPWMSVLIMIGIVGSWYLGGMIIQAVYAFLTQ